MFYLLLYHAIRKTYEDFEDVYCYRMNEADGTKIETDKELERGQVIILKHISDYARGGRVFINCTKKEYIQKV